MSAAVSNLVIHCLTNTTAINKPYKIRIFDFHCLIDEIAINRSSSTSRLLVWQLPMNIEANLNLFFFFVNLEGSEFSDTPCNTGVFCERHLGLNLEEAWGETKRRPGGVRLNSKEPFKIP